jgi:hypothetical protein
MKGLRLVSLWLACLIGVIGMAHAGMVADVAMDEAGILWEPAVSGYEAIQLTVSGAENAIFSQAFKAGTNPAFNLMDNDGNVFPDGQCNYELRVIDSGLSRFSGNVDPNLRGMQPASEQTLVQVGAFIIQGGRIVMAPEQQANYADFDPGSGPAPEDHLIYDDLIVTGSICVGFDCANGESFGYCTLKLKENNLQLCFEDTSVGSFPTRDWKIQINDTTSGGATYFTIWDTDAGRRPFTIEGGAPAHSLYVEDYGRVGLGTSIPYVELHIVDGDSPTIRLDQDGSSGWVAQRWDLCGNETNFFIRDVTNGSKLCFRIQPNTPSNTLCMRSTGNVGIGTWSPSEPLELEKTGADARFIAQRTDGATALVSGGASQVFMGSTTNHAVRFVTNGTWRMQLNTSNSLDMANGASCTVAGVWEDNSSRELKENIRALTAEDAFAALQGLSPMRYNYKAEKGEEYLGFIAEDVPDLVASSDRKRMSSMDVVAVLTRVVKEQQTMMTTQQQIIGELEAKIDRIENKIQAQ